MAELGPIHQFLGLEFERDRKNLILYVHQPRSPRHLWTIQAQRPLDSAADK